MAKGPAIDLNKIDMTAPVNTGFRIITTYLPQFDETVVRIDLKIGDKQYTVGFKYGNVIQPKEHQAIRQLDDLMTPTNGIEACINIKANKDEILKALKELVSDIEGTNASKT